MFIQRGFRDLQVAVREANASVPGEDQIITIVKPGGYTIAYSGQPIIDRDGDRPQIIDALNIHIFPDGGGQDLPLEQYESFQDIDDGQSEYVPLLTVHFDDPGTYVLRSSLSGEVDADKSALVLSESPFRKLRDGARVALLFLVSGIVSAIVTTMALARARGRAKRVARASIPIAPWAPPY